MKIYLTAWMVGASLCLFAATSPSFAATPAERDVTYAKVDGLELKLDLYRAQANELAPLIVWVHGGAWRSGSKDKVPIDALVDKGYAIASVDYRLSPTARFPAQVHDIKAAIRFMRTNAQKYELDPSRFVVAGASAGGHLAALVGVTGGVKALEGDVGECDATSSQVQAIVDFYGASNLQTILNQSTPHGLSVRVPALELLLGGQPTVEPELARLASPVSHVDANDPPLLLIHGDQDPQMPINQAHELFGRYQSVKAKAEFEVIYGGAHGGSEFYSPEMIDRVSEFLDQFLPAPARK